MRIGLTAVATTTDQIVDHVVAAERDGFTSMWFASYLAGDPLVAMAIAGRATTRIELGAAVLQTYPCHPVLQANRAAAAAAGRPTPRVVAGLPVSVHDDADEARAAAAASARRYQHLPNYRRILERGAAVDAVDAAVVGDEADVTRQLQGLVDAGATDVQAFVVPAGPDGRASIRRTRDLLASLCG